MSKFRVKEVWRVTGYAYIEAENREDAQKRLEDGEGDFDEQSGEWEYYESKGEIEECCP